MTANYSRWPVITRWRSIGDTPPPAEENLARPALGKFPGPEAKQPQYREVNHHTARHQPTQMQDARPTGSGQPALLSAHTEPQRETKRQQRDAHLEEEFRPAGFRPVDVMLAQVTEQDRGIETRAESDGEREAGKIGRAH